MELSRETAKKRGGGPASVRNVLSGSSSGSIIIWGRDLSFVVGDVQESGGSARGISQTGNGKEPQASEGQDLEKRGSGKSTQGSGNPDTGAYIDKLQATVAEWVELKPIIEIYDRETGYRGGVKRREPWW